MRQNTWQEEVLLRHARMRQARARGFALTVQQRRQLRRMWQDHQNVFIAIIEDVQACLYEQLRQAAIEAVPVIQGQLNLLDQFVKKIKDEAETPEQPEGAAEP